MTGPQIAIVAVAVFLAVPIIMCHLLGRPEKLPGRPGFPAVAPMRQRPRTPGATHWGDDLPADVVTALHNEAREITRTAALDHATSQKAPTCPSSQAATAQENT